MLVPQGHAVLVMKKGDTDQNEDEDSQDVPLVEQFTGVGIKVCRTMPPGSCRVSDVGVGEEGVGTQIRTTMMILRMYPWWNSSQGWGSRYVRLIESTATLYRDRGSPSECPWFAIHDEACRVVYVANHWHEDGIPLSLPQCGDRWFFSHAIFFYQKPDFNGHFSCAKHSAMAPLPVETSCYWQRHDVIIYLAQNDGAKMLSTPWGWDTLGWDNISLDVQMLGTYLSPVGENVLQALDCGSRWIWLCAT